MSRVAHAEAVVLSEPYKKRARPHLTAAVRRKVCDKRRPLRDTGSAARANDIHTRHEHHSRDGQARSRAAIPSYITRRIASLSARWPAASGRRNTEMAAAMIMPLIARAVFSTSRSARR